MTHLTNFSNICIPEKQIVFGTKEYQNDISNLFYNSEYKNQNIYVTKSVNDVIASVLSNKYNKNNNTRIGIINGLDVILSNIKFDIENQLLFITLRPGIIIIDSVIINITEKLKLKFDLSKIDSIFVYDKLLITAEYLYIKNTPIEYSIFLYDSKNNILFNDLNKQWNDNLFIHNTFNLNLEKYNITKYDYPGIVINNKEYPSRFFNYYQEKYINILLELSHPYFIDDIYSRPFPVSFNSVFELTGVFR